MCLNLPIISKSYNESGDFSHLKRITDSGGQNAVLNKILIMAIVCNNVFWNCNPPLLVGYND